MEQLPSGISQQEQRDSRLTEIQEANFHKMSCIVLELAPGICPPTKLASHAKTQTEPMSAEALQSFAGMILGYRQKLEQQHLLQQRQQQLQQQQHQHQQQQRQSAIAEQNQKSLFAQQQAQAHAQRQQALEVMAKPQLDKQAESSHSVSHDSGCGSEYSSGPDSLEQTHAAQKLQGQSALPQQHDQIGVGHQGSSQQRLLSQQGALPASTQANAQRQWQQQQQQQQLAGQLQQQGFWPQSPQLQPQLPEANPLLQPGMPDWQRQLLLHAHPQQQPPAQQAEVEQAQPNKLPQAATKPWQAQKQAPEYPQAESHQGSAAKGLGSLMQTNSLSLQGHASNNAKQLNAARHPQTAASRKADKEQPQSQQDQLQQAQAEQDLMQSQQNQLRRAQSGLGQLQHPHSQQGQSPKQQRLLHPQAGPMSQQAFSAHQSQQLNQLSKLASLSHGLPGHQGDSVRSELQAMQQKLLAQHPPHSSESNSQVP